MSQRSSPASPPGLAASARAGRPAALILMDLLVHAASEAEARAALDEATTGADGTAAQRLAEVTALWAAQPHAWKVVRAVMEEARHEAAGPASPDDAVTAWAATFDRLATRQPEAGVALYALGDPARLEAASREVVDALLTSGDLRPGDVVLDLGCGIGRLARPLSEHAGFVLGLDVSEGMLAQAAARSAGWPRLAYARTSGRDLAPVAEACSDLVLVADVMPYWVLAGGELPARMLREAARVLRPGGRLVIANVSYRGDEAADVADADRWAGAAGLGRQGRAGRPLSSWDALVLRYARLAQAVGAPSPSSSNEEVTTAVAESQTTSASTVATSADGT